MPNADGKIAGHGWSRAHEDAWERVFGNAATPRPGYDANRFVDFETRMEFLDLFDDAVPREPTHEDIDDRNGEEADRSEAAGWGR